MKRPILGLLAAVLFSYGFGLSPAHAAAPSSAESAVAIPAHGDGGHKHSSEHGSHQPSRHHDRGFHHDDDGDGHDHDGDGHRRRRCEGLIVICLI